MPCLTDGRIASAQKRNLLPRENERPRRALSSQHELPGFERFQRVGWADDVTVRRGPQRRELLDGLVCGPVFTEKDGIVREDVDRVNAGQAA